MQMQFPGSHPWSAVQMGTVHQLFSSSAPTGEQSVMQGEVALLQRHLKAFSAWVGSVACRGYYSISSVRVKRGIVTLLQTTTATTKCNFKWVTVKCRVIKVFRQKVIKANLTCTSCWRRLTSMLRSIWMSSRREYARGECLKWPTIFLALARVSVTLRCESRPSCTHSPDSAPPCPS